MVYNINGFGYVKSDLAWKRDFNPLMGDFRGYVRVNLVHGKFVQVSNSSHYTKHKPLDSSKIPVGQYYLSERVCALAGGLPFNSIKYQTPNDVTKILCNVFGDTEQQATARANMILNLLNKQNEKL